jgi:glycosyltransferase involved in cell wall biosynthesis
MEIWVRWKEMVKILINAVRLVWGRKGGGLDVYVYYFAKKLVEHGHEVYLLVSFGDNYTELEVLRKCGLKVYSIPTKSSAYGLIKYFLLSTLKSISVIKTNKIDLIHSHDIYSGVSGAIVSYFTKKPLVTTFHGGNIPSLKWEIKKFIRRIVSCWSSKIIILNEKQRSEFMSYGFDNKKLELIHTGVDVNEFDVNIDKKFLKSSLRLNVDDKIILSLSLLNKRKNIKLLIKAFSIVAQRETLCKLIIAGDGPERQNLERLAKELNISDKVIFTGVIKSRKGVIELMKCADVFVLTSLEEGLPLAVLEAMAARTPVISTKVGAVPEVIENGKNGLLASYNPFEVADAIIKVISDNAFAEKISENAFETIKSGYTWEHVAIKNIECYLSVLNNKARI